MIFDYLIAIVSLKAAEIGMSEVQKKKDDFEYPPFPQWTANDTARRVDKIVIS